MATPSYHSDLGFVAALMTLGFEIGEQLRRADDGRLEFCVHIESVELKKQYPLFRNGKLMVDAQQNAQSIKHLKKLLQTHKGGQN